jgi:hypothetical protein
MRCRADDARLVLLRPLRRTKFTKVMLCGMCIGEAPGAGYLVIDVIPGLPPDPPEEPQLPRNVVPFPGSASA